MKQLITFLALIISYMLCGAQATSLTVDNQTPGWLSSKINYGDQQTIKNLTVTGYINHTDLTFIGDMMSKHNLSGNLNLTDVEVVDVEYEDSRISIGGSLAMFNLSQSVSLERFSIPKSLSKISPYLLAGVKADTLDYGSERCQILSKLLKTNRSYGTNSCPKVLILRDGVTKIELFGTDEGDEKNLKTIVLPQTIDSIGNNAFKGCTNLVNINLPNNIHTIGEGAFAETSICPDTLYLPASLRTYYTSAFPLKNGQVIVLGSEVNRFNNSSWYLKKTTNVTYIINRITPPTFTKGESVNLYSDGKELSGCTLYVPKEGYSMYADPEYNSVGVGGTWSGWTNPYSHAKINTIHIPVNEIVLNHSTTILNVGNSIDLIASVLPTDADNKSILWSTSNHNIASVSTTGLVTALSCGNAVITAYSSENSNIYATCEVTVHQPLQSILLNTRNITLNAGQMYDGLSLTYYPATADNKNVTWESSNTEVVIVDGYGKVTAIRGGEAKITVSSVENSDIKDECKVTVLQPTTGVYLDKSDIEIIEDESIQLIATVLPESASNKALNWTSSDISIAMVSPDGTVYALKAGQATIMVTTVDGGFAAFCKVTVKAKTVLASNIVLSTNSGTIAIGESLQLNAIISPDNTTNKMVNWTSSNPQIASVDTSGLVSAIAEGDALIIASTQDGTNLTATCQISVCNDNIFVESIVLNPSKIEGAVNDTYQIEATILPNNASNKTLSWNSSDENIATVEDGLVKLKNLGAAIIIAEAVDGSNAKSECAIVVSHEADIDEIIADKNTFVKIFNLSGYLIYEGIYAEAKLTPGFFIIICNGSSIKARID